MPRIGEPNNRTIRVLYIYTYITIQILNNKLSFTMWRRFAFLELISEPKTTSQKFRDNIQYLQIALHPLWEKCFVKKYSSITLHCIVTISDRVTTINKWGWGSLYFAQADEFPQNNCEECDQLAVTKSERGRCHLWPGRPETETRRYWSPVTGRQPGNYKDGSWVSPTWP